MKHKNQTYLLYLVGLTILVTIGIQFYWNQQNYLTNQQQLFREVQDCLDRSVDAYYEETSQNSFITLIDTINTTFSKNGSNTFELLNLYNNLFSDKDDPLDTRSKSLKDSLNILIAAKSGIVLLKGKNATAKRKDLDEFPNRIVISENQDSIQFPVLKKLLDTSLKNRNIETAYVLNHLKKHTLFQKFGLQDPTENYLRAVSISTLLPTNESIELLYLNPSKSIYQKGLIGISLSFILACIILFCLLYLLRVIKRQKELSMIKNDFMSNVTHELKTPIATVQTALEGISKFNHENDPEKTKKYLKISNDQLTKLNIMVEKILDTASLDSDRLILSLEKINLIEMLSKLVKKYKVSYPEIQITFDSDVISYLHLIDPFHFENALNNVIDNACKYGKGQVQVHAYKTIKGFEINIKDNGPGIPKNFQKHIFEKFFRVPKGNQHDIKGFGIGLYYAKNILNKHGFTLFLTPDEKWTTFNISVTK